MFKFSAINSVPALPGAQKTFDTFSSFAIDQAIACSLPPDPIINTLYI